MWKICGSSCKLYAIISFLIICNGRICILFCIVCYTLIHFGNKKKRFTSPKPVAGASEHPIKPLFMRSHAVRTVPTLSEANF